MRYKFERMWIHPHEGLRESFPHINKEFTNTIEAFHEVVKVMRNSSWVLIDHVGYKEVRFQ